MAILYDTEHDLRSRAQECLKDDFKHNAIETAQETFYKKRGELVGEMAGWEQIRSKAAHIRQKVANDLDYYVKQFAQNAEAAGNIMHYAPTAQDALNEILDVLESRDVNFCVKSKSMMTEEMGLNSYLENAGIEVIETDCAENILQTAKDMPSHIVVPALHFDRKAICELYRKECGYDGDEVPEHITHFLRKMLREKFLAADVGIRGCNFAVAETGSVTLVTNEGNGRMVDTCPKLQIIVVGIDRIVPDLESLDMMMALLPRSAVGAKMTAYFSLDTGPRRQGESDGPVQTHIVLMDNGRHDLINSEFEPMLRCIRCGACLNICPVYRHITGHGYGSIYPGPMGIVLTAALEGYDDLGGLVNACTLCAACAEHCPVQIPLHDLVRAHRINMTHEHKVHKAEKPVFSGLKLLWSNVGFYKFAMKIGRPVLNLLAKGDGSLDERSAWIPILKGWTKTRDFPTLPKKRFRTWFKEHEEEIHPPLRVQTRGSAATGANTAGANVAQATSTKAGSQADENAKGGE